MLNKIKRMEKRTTRAIPIIQWASHMYRTITIPNLLYSHLVIMVTLWEPRNKRAPRICTYMPWNNSTLEDRATAQRSKRNWNKTENYWNCAVVKRVSCDVDGETTYLQQQRSF